MEAIIPISDNIVVLNAGRKITEGAPQDVVNNEEVIKAYLGIDIMLKVKILGRIWKRAGNIRPLL